MFLQSNIKLSKTTETAISYSIIFAAVIFVFLFGIIGLFREPNLDFKIFYDSGVLVSQGIDPWLNPPGGAFAYPPHIVPFLYFYNVFPLEVAAHIQTAISICALAVICYLANIWFIKIDSFKDISIVQAICISIIFGNPYVTHILFMGHLTLVIAAAMFLSWHYLNTDRWFLSGLFLALATIKPPLSVLYVVWLLFSLQIRVLTVGAGIALLLLIPASLEIGFPTVLMSWLSSLASYSQVDVNSGGSVYTVSFGNIAESFGIKGTGLIFALSSLVLITIAFIYRKTMDDITRLQLLFVISLLFIYGQNYDLAATAILFSYAIYISCKDGITKWTYVVLALTFAFFLPQRFVRHLDIALLNHMRSFILLVCWVLVYQLKRNNVEKSQDFTAPMMANDGKAV